MIWWVWVVLGMMLLGGEMATPGIFRGEHPAEGGPQRAG